MASYTVFGDTVPAAPNEIDADGSYGTVIDIADGAVGTVTHARWRFPDTLPSGTVTWHLYDLTNDTALAEHAFVSPAAGQWVAEELAGTGIAGPEEITGPRRVIAWVGTPDRYTATGGVFLGAATVSGPLSAPATETVANGRFGGDPESVPSGTYNGGCYFADLVWEEAPPPANAGEVALGIQFSLSAAGESPDVPPAEGSAAVGLVLAVAASGDAPDLPPATGAAGLELLYSFSATGLTPVTAAAEGTAAVGLVLAVAAAGEAPAVAPASGSAGLVLRFDFGATGVTPDEPPPGAPGPWLVTSFSVDPLTTRAQRA